MPKSSKTLPCGRAIPLVVSHASRGQPHTLDGLSSGWVARTRTTRAAHEMDAKFDFFERSQGAYGDPNFPSSRPRPRSKCSSCSISPVKSFHTTTNSSPAASRLLLLPLYIRHHPLASSNPGRTKRIWLNWGPPLYRAVVGDSGAPPEKALERVLQDMKIGALEQIRARRGSTLCMKTLQRASPSLLSMTMKMTARVSSWVVASVTR